MKIKKLCYILLLTLFLLPTLTNSDITRYENQDYIEEILLNINTELVEMYIQTLQDFGPRVTGTESSILSGEYIYQEFQRLGLEAQFLPWENGNYEDRNIEAILPGENEKSIIICAHFDSVPGSPGADDNGSGTAAVLAAAKVISEYHNEINFSYTLRFIAFSGEEEGLLGSYRYAEEAHEANMPILGVLNADMIGYTRDEIGAGNIYVYENERSQWLTNISMDVADTYEDIFGLDITRRRAGGGSDHWPFLQYGYDALFFHEHDFNDYYHSVNDTVDMMDLDYDTRCTQLIVATLLHLANLNIFDDEPPAVELVRPRDNYLYIADREIMPTLGTIVIGGITMHVNASDEKTGIDKVEIYLDDTLQTELYSYPYNYPWDELAFFSHYFRAVSYDNAGNTAIAEKKVWIFNI